MKEQSYYSKQLTELLKNDYHLDESFINKHHNIINDENKAFKLTLFLIQIETSISDRDQAMKEMHKISKQALESFDSIPNLDLVANSFKNLFL